MSISSITGAAGNAALQLIESLTGGNKNATAVSAASVTDPEGSASLSQVGQFFAKLQNLAENSPDQFKQLTAQIATELNSAAQQATGSTQQFLQQLANRFQTASQTGSVASLQPSQDSTSTAAASGAQGHHRHHHHGGGYSSSEQSGNSTDLFSALSASPTDNSSSTIGSLFQNIYQQVMQA